jgi:hypothetical protein
VLGTEEEKKKKVGGRVRQSMSDLAGLGENFGFYSKGDGRPL